MHGDNDAIVPITLGERLYGLIRARPSPTANLPVHRPGVPDILHDEVRTLNLLSLNMKSADVALTATDSCRTCLPTVLDPIPKYSLLFIRTRS